jgi:hypothetical protein
MATISTNRKVRRETMRRPVAAIGSAVFFVVGPGIRCVEEDENLPAG